MFTVEVKLKGNLILARSANRIAGNQGEMCLYATDDGRFIEHHWNAGAAVLAAILLSGCKNILIPAHEARVNRWVKNRLKIETYTSQAKKKRKRK